MAIVTRYFSTTSAGAGDGTTWADRAALFTGGAWSTVITGFNFSGSDSLLALVGPGTHTITAALASGSFANAPSAANPLLIHACDSSGNRISPPDPNWSSDLPAFNDSTLPILATTTNIATINLANSFYRLIKFTSSGATTNTPIPAAAGLDWCLVANSASNTSAVAIGPNVGKLSNSVISMTGSSYSSAIGFGAGPQGIFNCRITGVTGSSGNRNGVLFQGSASGYAIERCTIIGHGGDAIGTSTATATHFLQVRNCTIANNAGAGIKLNSTASQTGLHVIDRCMITGSGSYGIDAQSTARLFATGNRLRDNTSGNLNGLGNYPSDWDNFTSDSDDATEYVDSSSGDYRVKSTATIWGSGYGVSEQPPSGGPVVLINGGNVR